MENYGVIHEVGDMSPFYEMNNDEQKVVQEAKENEKKEKENDKNK